MKMNGLLSVLLATSAALLFTAKGQENYDMLRELDKKHVDMVKGQEFKINLLLKATVCPKASSDSEHKHRHDCGFKPNRRDVIRYDKCSTLLHGAFSISSFSRDVLAVSDN
ncbi:unnamed protein product [Coregonus sp. 'balchen']|nr:unnamed protein product [Coregonus sp. 'balchen']